MLSLVWEAKSSSERNLDCTHWYLSVKRYYSENSSTEMDVIVSAYQYERIKKVGCLLLAGVIEGLVLFRKAFSPGKTDGKAASLDRVKKHEVGSERNTHIHTQERKGNRKERERDLNNGRKLFDCCCQKIRYRVEVAWVTTWYGV